MAGISNWNIKPDREADAHPREVYDAESDRYYFDPNKKTDRFISDIKIECDATPSPSEEYAEIVRDALRRKYPGLKAVEGDVPIAVRMSVYPAHFYAGGLQPYVVGESIVEWGKWLCEAFKGLVWQTDKQICVSGIEFRHREGNGIKIEIYMIYEQLQKKNSGR